MSGIDWSFEAMGNGQYAEVIGGLTHYNVSGSPLFAAATLAFLDAPTT
jgi:hypothetical protein